MALDMPSSAHRPAVSYTDLCTYTGEKLNIILVCLCLIRDLSQMCPRLASLLVPLPAVAVGVFYALCVPDIGRELLGLFIWRSDVCRLGEIFHVPFGRPWPSTLKAGTVPQVPRQPLTLTGLTLTQKLTVCSQFYFTFFSLSLSLSVCVCVCMCVCVGWKLCHPWVSSPHPPPSPSFNL